MSDLTSDPGDSRLTRGSDDRPVPQAEAYLVLSEEDRAKGYVRPFRTAYLHTTCGAVTWMNFAIAETYARQPTFYGATYCTHCRMHRPVGADGEFVWADGPGPWSRVGT